MFEFQGKTYKIVEDPLHKLVDGCNACAFSNDSEACADVDRVETGRVDCAHGNYHYEEVPAQSP